MFAPNFITRVATTIATVPFAVSMGLFAPEAKASTSTCYQTTNYDTVCIHSVRSHKTYGGAYKLVTSTVNGGNFATTEVDCTTASPSNYKRNLAGIACYEFN